MNRFRARAARSTIVAGLGLIALVAAERPLQARPAEPLLQPTPLVLKDGRIASVSIHVVPFAPGRADLGGEAATRVAELTRAAGTDCFLTAQVIGHIDSSEVAPDDTLNAHRLARARADAVQASLIGGGLPAKAIASVWDWQFMVRAPRATLWIFQLTAGEDCEGRPLDGALVAQAVPSRAAAAQPGHAQPSAAPTARPADPPAAQPDEAARPVASAAAAPSAQRRETRAATSSPTEGTPRPSSTRAGDGPAAGQRDAQSTVAARPALAPKSAPGDAGHEPAATQRAPEAEVAAKPAPAVIPPAGAAQPGQSSRPQPEPRTAVAAKPAAQAPAGAKQVQQPPQATASRAAVAATPAPAATVPSDGKVARGSEGSLVITFDNNSSFFPAGTARRLRELMAGMPPEHAYEVSVRVAVSGSTKVAGARSPQEAAAYNKWLAERRLERVQNWLLENARSANLSFRPEFVTDESRQVVLRLAPLG